MDEQHVPRHESTVRVYPFCACTPCLSVFFRHQDHFRAKIRIVLSKLCRKFGFEEIKRLMPEQDKKLVAHMQTTAEREIKAKKARLSGRGVEDNGAVRHGSRASNGGGGSDGPGEAGISKALRTFDAIMEGKFILPNFVFWSQCEFLILTAPRDRDPYVYDIEVAKTDFSLKSDVRTRTPTEIHICDSLTYINQPTRCT